MTPDQYCQERAARSGSSFYYSFLFLPEETRRGITALYAFCREVDDIADECTDTDVARQKLDWWRAEIARLYCGMPGHPVAQALRPFVESRALPPEDFREIVDGMEMDLLPARYPTWEALDQYCHRVAGVVGLLSARLFGVTDAATLDYAHELGLAFQYTNILRDVGEDAARGRVYVPAACLAAHGASVDDVLARRDGAALRKAFRELSHRARDHYRRAFDLLPDADRHAQRSGLIMAAIYLATLDRIEREDYPVLRRRVSLGALRKLWIAWRCARAEARRRSA